MQTNNKVVSEDAQNRRNREYAEAVQRVNETGDAYIRAGENGGVDPKTGKTKEELRALSDSQAAEALRLKGIANGGAPAAEIGPDGLTDSERAKFVDARKRLAEKEKRGTLGLVEAGANKADPAAQVEVSMEDESGAHPGIPTFGYPDIRHPHTEYSLAKAVSLAKGIMSISDPASTGPGSLGEARSVIEESASRKDHVWITGMAALDVLDAAIDGRDLAAGNRLVAEKEIQTSRNYPQMRPRGG